MRIWFALIGVLAGCLFGWEVYAITQLKEDAAVLEAKMKRSKDVLSDENVSSYMRAFFDGITFGRYANEGIFTEVKRMARKGEELEENAVRISVKYDMAKTVRNYALGVCGVFMLLGIAWPSRRTKRL